MHSQATLEGAECLRRSGAGWQSVPDALRSDEERAVTNRRTTQTLAAFEKSFRSLAPINEIGGWS